MDGISKKIYLELTAPTEEDHRSDQIRITDALICSGLPAKMSVTAMKKLYPVCNLSNWKLTVSLAWNGDQWDIVDIEAGDTVNKHYGYAVDLGSTAVVIRLMDCNTGKCIAESSCYNHQISYGEDILTRIFHCKDNPEALDKIRKATIDSINEVLKSLEEISGIPSSSCIQMVISGNTTMIHFLLGMDAFCVFHTPYTVHADKPGYVKAADIEIPLNGYVYIFPSKSNYLGGDIISGMIATEIYKQDDICAFFDIGTNGELVIGNKDFLLCGAGAAGPALEGGVVKTGMRATKGAVESVKLQDGIFHLRVIGDIKPQGICGSGIIDLIAELFLNGWIDIKGKYMPEKISKIQKIEDSYAVEYAPGLFFYQKDIDEFIKTKAAANIMVELMLKESGISLDEISKFYVAGAFGKHVSKESAITIGMYPDMDRDRLISAGNSSLDGAVKGLLNKNVLDDIDGILDHMTYIQFGAVDDFLQVMVAAQAIPHTDMSKYPSVVEKLNSLKG